ncbi:hypothetical protein RDI58_020791 [Solanum bulbocastanum]|uniref:Uncharacterized protein n=1 Tax=Solanum bulbocastanum TaxID=147425 RepID=A0AAN8Y816_SOLBU
MCHCSLSSLTLLLILTNNNNTNTLLPDFPTIVRLDQLNLQRMLR